MAETVIDERLSGLNISKRALHAISQRASLEEIAEAVKRRKTGTRIDGSTYTSGGWSWGISHGYPGVGNATSFEIASILLKLGLVSWEDCNFEGSWLVRSNRVAFNKALRKIGWTGPFHNEESKHFRRDHVKERLEALRSQLARMAKRKVKVEAEIARLEAHA